MTDVPTAPPLATIPGVEIVATGTWQLSSGEATFTKQDLADAIDAAQCPSVGPPVIKLGHVDPRFDGEPAVGKVLNMALTAEGNKITGDFASLPGWLGSPDKNGKTVISAAYPNRSIEGTYGFVCQIGHTHPFVITAVALLGVNMPGVGVLNSLDDVGSLFGVMASAADPGQPWTLEVGNMTDPVFAAGVTTEDVRREYYASPGVGYSYWITEMQIDPAQLIVCDDATNKVYRVPVNIKGGTVTFGDAVEVAVEYVDVAAVKYDGKTLTSNKPAVVTFASAEDSRKGLGDVAAWSGSTQVKNMGTDPSQSAINKMFALPGDTKSSSKLPHHTCSADGTVDGPDAGGCSAAIGALNGGRGGLTGVSDADKQKAYNHLAAHLRSLGQEPPEFTGSAGEPQDGVEGGDAPDASAGKPPTVDDLPKADDLPEPNQDAHPPAGDAKKHDDHAHASAEAGNKRTGGPDMEFTSDQTASLRASLGLAEDAEFTPEALVSAAATLRVERDAKVAAGAPKVPSTAMIVERSNYEALQREVEAGKKYRERKQREERDDIIDQAVRDGKFQAARVPEWKRVWDNDPDGTRAILASLPKNAVPVSDIGVPGGSDEDLVDEEYAALFPPAIGNGS